MSIGDVTVDGLRHTRPGREATITGPKGRSDGGDVPQGRSADGARPPGAPTPEQQRNRSGAPTTDSYYGLPVLNQPSWKAPDIAGYFFLGGLAGASSLLGAGAQLTGRPSLERGSKVVAAGAIGLSLAALIHDLGRPARFVNMLRVVKVTSPMSIGSWLLAAYAPATVVAAGSAVSGRFRGLGRMATAATVALGPAVASYTGALVADTAVPAWHDGHREMPFLFAASAASAAGGAGMVLAPLGQASPARRLAIAGSGAELALAKVMERRMGMVGEAYHSGKAGRLMRAAEALGIGGTVGAAVLGGRSRLGAAVSGVALVAASALTRFGIFEAGVQSAADPRSTVEPQRQRLEAAGRTAP
jgi:formate-dependent nitrite reductase membrane component NrfD